MIGFSRTCCDSPLGGTGCSTASCTGAGCTRCTDASFHARRPKSFYSPQIYMSLLYPFPVDSRKQGNHCSVLAQWSKHAPVLCFFMPFHVLCQEHKMHRYSLKALKLGVPQRSADDHLKVSAAIVSRIPARQKCGFLRNEALDAVAKSGRLWYSRASDFRILGSIACT